VVEALGRRVSSTLLLCLFLWGAWQYVGVPDRAPARSSVAPQTQRPIPFHAYDRANLPAVEGVGSCTGCHGPAAHARTPSDRALLNLHHLSMDCGVCHLTGRGIAVRRFRGHEVVTAETLASATGGRIFAARKSDSGWTPVVTVSDGVKQLAQAPACADCHRRGSLVLAADGVLDSYRRRLLEDLSILRRMGRGDL
jgi:hypothetical protein